MPVVTITESLLQRLTISDGRILRDRILAGFCVRAGSRHRTFIIATSCKGQQVRLSLGAWPLLGVEEARGLAAKILKDCRAGIAPMRQEHRPLPTLEQALDDYAKAKGIKASSVTRYHSIVRTHFGEWQSQTVLSLNTPAFAHRCHEFAQTKGAALVEVGRGLVGALIKYLNAVHSLSIRNPFHRLADAGLMPERAKPRARLLREDELPQWRAAVEKLGEKQRDYLLLLLYTGLRRDEGHNLTPADIDFNAGILSIADTKNGKPHSLPITPMMDDILRRRCDGLADADRLFKSVSKEHVYSMAIRQGAPRFMLHDLRKLLATIGERLKVGDAVLRRILNHTAPKSDVLHKHYVSLAVEDVRPALVMIQRELAGMANHPSPARSPNAPP